MVWLCDSVSLPRAVGPGAKNSDLSSHHSHLTRFRSENWNSGLKFKIQIQMFYKNILTDGRGLSMQIKVRSNFLHKIDPKLFCISNSNWTKNWSAHIGPVDSHVFDQNGLPNRVLITQDGNFFIILIPLKIGLKMEID